MCTFNKWHTLRINFLSKYYDTKCFDSFLFLFLTLQVFHATKILYFFRFCMFKILKFNYYRLWKDMTMFNADLEDERTKYTVWRYPIKNKFTRILNTIEAFGFPSNFTDAVERMENSKVPLVLIDIAMRVKYLTMTNCDYMAIGKEFDETPIALIVQKNSKLRDKLNDALAT